MIKYITLIEILIFAAWSDIRIKKVSNILILFAFGLGLYFQIYEHNIPGLYYFLKDAMFPIVVLYLLFLLHALGAGDIKLFSVISSFLGVRVVSKCIIISIFIGGIFSLCKVIKNHKHYDKNLVLNFIKRMYYSGFDTEMIVNQLLVKNRNEENTICFTIPILLSCLICIREVIL